MLARCDDVNGQGAVSGVTFILLGGFLGAGKTSTVLRLAFRLRRAGKRVGIITNDQAAGLVDTALVDNMQLPVREIAGGCFCCRSDSLVAALTSLRDQDKPDVLIAEPVGSCTDLIATVVLPLRRVYKKTFRIAPYSVLVDPFRALQTLSSDTIGPFSEDINYIYRKQLEEAELILINKIDAIPEPRLRKTRAAIELNYPDAKCFEVSARRDVGLARVLKALLTRSSRPNRIMEVDYERYAAGEASLGWYNARFQVRGGRNGTPSNLANGWLKQLAEGVCDTLMERKIEVAHFKAVLKPDDSNSTARSAEIAAISSVGSGRPTELWKVLKNPFTTGILLLNIRAEASPEDLGQLVTGTLSGIGSTMQAILIHREAFRPEPPNPTHRMSSV